jgi:hypothetical protein
MSKVEEWRPILEIPENRYLISNLGRVKNNKDLILKPNIDKNGYHLIHLHYKGVRKVKKIHRLVLEYFLYPCNLDVNHINGNKQDNKLSNLEYCTKSENMLHAVKNNLCTNSSKKGEEHNTYKYSFLEVMDIRDMRNRGCTYKEIINKYKCDRSWLYLVIYNKIRQIN